MMNTQKKHIFRFAGAMLAHVVLLAATLVGIAVLAGNATTSPLVAEGSLWRYLLIPIPAIPVIYGVAVLVRAVRDMDELQQRIQLEAFAFALGATGVLTFVYGYLELAGLPHINPVVVLPAMAALWAVGLALASRRYR
jgi:hypothetical protein